MHSIKIYIYIWWASPYSYFVRWIRIVVTSPELTNFKWIGVFLTIFIRRVEGDSSWLTSRRSFCYCFMYFFFLLRKQRRERNNKSKQSWFVTAPATTTYVSASRDATRTQNVWMLENLKGKHIKFIRIYRVCMNYIRLAISLRRGKCGVTHRVCPVDKHTACHPNRYRERESIEMTYANHI